MATGVIQPLESAPCVVLSAAAFQFDPAGFIGFDFDLERHRHGLYLNREKGSHALSCYADHQAEIQRYMDQIRVPDDVVHPLARPDA